MKVIKDKKIIFVNGIFDLLHPGHIALLRFAKSLGENLVVGINSDDSTRKLKGVDRPIHSWNQRKAALEDLPFVDEVVVFNDVRPTALICSLMPDVVVKGSEYDPEMVREVDTIPNGIEIITFPLVTDSKNVKISTTSLIEKLKK